MRGVDGKFVHTVAKLVKPPEHIPRAVVLERVASLGTHHPDLEGWLAYALIRYGVSA